MSLTAVKGRCAPYGNYICHTFQGGRLLWLAWKYAAACIFLVRHVCAYTCIYNACEMCFHILYNMTRSLRHCSSIISVTSELCCWIQPIIFVPCNVTSLLTFWTELACFTCQHEVGFFGCFQANLSPSLPGSCFQHFAWQVLLDHEETGCIACWLVLPCQLCALGAQKQLLT